MYGYFENAILLRYNIFSQKKDSAEFFCKNPIAVP